ncbi:MAG: hypothetical protein SGILL_003340, partial [Bacillariaceae sp.]
TSSLSSCSSNGEDSPPVMYQQKNNNSGSRYGNKIYGRTSTRSTSVGRSRSNGRPRRSFLGRKNNIAAKHKEMIRDSSIIKGAEILKKELSMKDSDDDSYEPQFDPFRQPTRSLVGNSKPILVTPQAEKRQEDISELTEAYYVEDTAAAVGANWVTNTGSYDNNMLGSSGQDSHHDVFEDIANEDFGGQVPQPFVDPPEHDDDEDTMNVIERAMSFLSATSKSFESPPPNNVQKQSPVSPRETASPHQQDYLVKRLSSEDNNSFQSMFGSNYLPNNLSWGGNNSNKQSNQQRYVDEAEEHETSTLDYIANLYVDKSAKNSRSPSTKENQLRPLQSDNDNKLSRSDRQLRTPRITQAAAPFQDMVAPSSYFYDDLLKDPAYQHALKAGALWQSLCSQHVRFPALWWDGQEPAAPPLGTAVKSPWNYLGRHRVLDDRKLNVLIGNRGSSGRLLLHLVIRDDVTCEPVEDIACGVFHPNARGVRTSADFDPRVEDCRDIWIGHRRRVQGQSRSMLESLLQRQNKNRAFPSPLGGAKSDSSDIHNGNLKAVFGEKPPLFTVFVTESELFELIRSECRNRASPVSVVLLRRYLRYRLG